MFAYDDIASSEENPFPGKVFNRPTFKGTAGVDVYAGCNIDYAGKSITPQTFAAVLAGNTSVVETQCAKAGKNDCRSGTKVLKSGPNDNVFVNFVDHGGSRIIGFPDGSQPSTMTASALVKTLKAMQRKKMYSKLTFYMEACNSGSMFDGLLTDDMNIYVTTAANPSEPSYGCFCAPYDKVDGKELNTCLGDLYSVNWMNDSDTSEGMAHTLQQQFTKVKNETTGKSHVMEYGTMAFDTDLVSDFQTHATKQVRDTNGAHGSIAPTDAVDIVDIDLVQAFYRYMRTETGNPKRAGYASKLLKEVASREAQDAKYPRILDLVAAAGHDANAAPTPYCEEEVTVHTMQVCGKFTSYGLKYSRPLTKLCATNSLTTIKAAIEKVCA
jgi:legumain